MHRLSALVAATLLAAGLGACDDTVPPAPATPTASPGASVSSAAYLLRGAPITGYQRGSDLAVTAQNIADQWPDPKTAAAVATELQQDGYLSGSQAVYNQPSPPPPVMPFAEIRSNAYIFGSAAGATHFFTAEAARQNQDQQQGGSVTALNDAPRDNADQILAIQEVDPGAGAGAGAPANRAYFALVRRGRVVIELFGRINLNSTTTEQFLSLLKANEATLATSPD